MSGLTRRRLRRVGASDRATAEAARSPLQPVKCRAIDAVFARQGVRSFADLGAVWAVEAGYTFYAVDSPGVERAVVVDTGITDVVRRRADADGRVQLLDGNFGDPVVIDRIGRIDAVLLFDVLLHQVAPDWDDVLRAYAEIADSFVIVNPQWVGSDRTTRLLDLGREDYLANVPAEQIDIDFDDLDALHPKYQRPWRDIHEIWQWGITDDDLHRVMRELGRELVFFEDAGTWQQLGNFRNRSFGYVRA